MRLIPLVFINRFSKIKSWPVVPKSFRDVIMFTSEVTEDQIIEFESALFKALLKLEGNQPVPYIQQHTISVVEKKSEASSCWYLRTLSFNKEETPIVIEESSPLLETHSDQNDMRNKVWFDLDTCTLLTYNKNAVRRLQLNFKNLAHDHISKCIPQFGISEELREIYGKSEYCREKQSQ